MTYRDDTVGVKLRCEISWVADDVQGSVGVTNPYFSIYLWCSAAE
jgi:hypothetical protein